MFIFPGPPRPFYPDWVESMNTTNSWATNFRQKQHMSFLGETHKSLLYALNPSFCCDEPRGCVKAGCWKADSAGQEWTNWADAAPLPPQVWTLTMAGCTLLSDRHLWNWAVAFTSGFIIVTLQSTKEHLFWSQALKSLLNFPTNVGNSLLQTSLPPKKFLPYPPLRHIPDIFHSPQS